MLGAALAEAPDPELARVALERVGEQPAAREALAREDIAATAVRLLGFSSAAADFFTRHPPELAALADVHERSRENLDRELGNDLDVLGPAAGLRRFRVRAMLRVASRD